MRLLLALLIAASSFSSFAAEEERVKIALLSEQPALVPGRTAWLGIRLQHEPHWHTYWVNPGDSGLPTTLSWRLPMGFRAGEIAWPAPQRLLVGDLYNFGYEGDTLLPVPIDVPAEAKPGTTVHLGVEVKYLVCRDECIPGKANVALDLPVSATAASERQPLFAAARAAQPRNAAWTGAAQVSGERIEVDLHAAEFPAISDVIVVQRKVVDYAPPQISRHGNVLNVSFAKSDYFVSAPAQIDLLLRAGAQTWMVRIPVSSL